MCFFFYNKLHSREWRNFTEQQRGERENIKIYQKMVISRHGLSLFITTQSLYHHQIIYLDCYAARLVHVSASLKRALVASNTFFSLVRAAFHSYTFRFKNSLCCVVVLLLKKENSVFVWEASTTLDRVTGEDAIHHLNSLILEIWLSNCSARFFCSIMIYFRHHIGALSQFSWFYLLTCSIERV